MELKCLDNFIKKYNLSAYNRTIWNWNFDKNGMSDGNEKLIIVPYGIEMYLRTRPIYFIQTYNRTIWNWNAQRRQLRACRPGLIIVPYGIEIQLLDALPSFILYLIIVPYGIEILDRQAKQRNSTPYNRTIWNWNYSVHARNLKSPKLIIVPYGIEIIQPEHFRSGYRSL